MIGDWLMRASLHTSRSLKGINECLFWYMEATCKHAEVVGALDRILHPADAPQHGFGDRFLAGTVERSRLRCNFLVNEPVDGGLRCDDRALPEFGIFFNRLTSVFDPFGQHDNSGHEFSVKAECDGLLGGIDAGLVSVKRNQEFVDVATQDFEVIECDRGPG